MATRMLHYVNSLAIGISRPEPKYAKLGQNRRSVYSTSMVETEHPVAILEEEPS